MASRSLVIPRQADSTQGRARKGARAPSLAGCRRGILAVGVAGLSRPVLDMGASAHSCRVKVRAGIEIACKWAKKNEKEGWDHLFFGNSAKYPETALFWSSIMEHTRLWSGASPRFSRWLRGSLAQEIASMYLRSALGFVAASVLSASLATTSYAQPSKSMPTAQGPSKQMPSYGPRRPRASRRRSYGPAGPSKQMPSYGAPQAPSKQTPATAPAGPSKSTPSYGAPQAPSKQTPSYGAPQAPEQVRRRATAPRRPRASRRRATAPRRPPASRRRATAPRRPRPSRPRRAERSSRRSIAGSRSPVVLAAGDSRRPRAPAPTTSSRLAFHRGSSGSISDFPLSRVARLPPCPSVDASRRVCHPRRPARLRCPPCRRGGCPWRVELISGKLSLSIRRRPGRSHPRDCGSGAGRSGRCFQGRRAVSQARSETLADCSGGCPRAGKAALSEVFRRLPRSGSPR